MSIHNLMEEIVISRVNALFDESVKSQLAWLTCDCEQCRTDTICYTLNKVPPKYIVSSRGVAYAHQESPDARQLTIDIDRIIIDGMKQIMSTRRPHYNAPKTDISAELRSAFIFPVIVGKILSGATFEPVCDVQARLLFSGDLVEMIDPSWQNPYSVVRNTAGIFTFWPKPIAAESNNEQRLFSFELLVKTERFETLHHFFDLQISSAEPSAQAINMREMYKIQDLYLFPR